MAEKIFLFSPKVALLTFSEYYTLNHAISTARGWQLGGDTERTFSMSPQACKVDIIYDEEGNEVSYTVKLVMPLSSEIQETHAELLQGITLHTDFTPVDNPIQELVIDVLEMDVLGWTFEHFVHSGGTEDGLTLIASPEFVSTLSPEMMEGITQMGLNIQVK